MKRQTIWLLTMLSLVVVLSVYYVTTPNQTNTANFMKMSGKQDLSSLDSTSNVNSDKTKETSNKSSEKTKPTAKKQNAINADEVMEKQRMDQEDTRSQQIEEYKSVVDSATATAQQKSEALSKVQTLEALSAKEQNVEEMIKSAGYKDALVQANDNEVRVTVKSKTHSRKAANDIIQMTRSELGEKLVEVDFQTK
ncbi:SpoIIIAH-like family protein [Bacillus sp. RG28]|uniref:SpoIIIAH-like family protein n=1 Tax=Gottfriedia endophytica TaxID=2820819 RepID=A0A940SJ12_9BACI|nr:SpoIIIAH-like family protein [Gottfriedia endophytica]MBP0724414.1 SpoIIIAH-like family protein [Gottfriedia endophytica]